MRAAESTVRHLSSAVASPRGVCQSLEVELFSHYKLLFWRARDPWQHAAPPQSGPATSSHV